MTLTLGSYIYSHMYMFYNWKFWKKVAHVFAWQIVVWLWLAKSVTHCHLIEDIIGTSQRESGWHLWPLLSLSLTAVSMVLFWFFLSFLIDWTTVSFMPPLFASGTHLHDMDFYANVNCFCIACSFVFSWCWTLW